MAFQSVRLSGFRNLEDAEVDTHRKAVFLVGENGQGKTNFLEAVYFSSYASSFNTLKDHELIKKGNSACSISSVLDNNFFKTIFTKIENGKKSVFLDSKAIEDRRELLDVIPSIVFCHDDMSYITGTPEMRRWFFDQSLTLFDQSYLDILRRYKKVLKTRNLIIKERKTSILEVLDLQYVELGLALMTKREQATAFFSEVFKPLYKEVSEIGGVSVCYAPSWKKETAEAILLHLSERREMEIAFGSSLSGPHRDRYQFIRNGVDFSSTASTGQKRLLALLLKVSQAARYTQAKGRPPVLLLDDVLLELDPCKKKRFMNILPTYEQAFFTFLPGEPIKDFGQQDALVYSVKEGVLSK